MSHAVKAVCAGISMRLAPQEQTQQNNRSAASKQAAEKDRKNTVKETDGLEENKRWIFLTEQTLTRTSLNKPILFSTLQR